jgi:hypothetical protein
MPDVTPPPPIALQGPSNTPGAPPLSLAALASAINTHDGALTTAINTSLDGLNTTLTGIQGNVTTSAGQIQDSLTAAQSSLASDSAALTAVQSSVTGMQTTLTAIQAAIAALGGSPQPGPTPSPDGTTVTTAGPTIIDAALNSWTLQQSAASGFQVALNGTVDQSTSNVVLIIAEGGVVYQANNWVPPGWWKNPTGVAGVWVTTTDPRPAAPETITDVRLSNQSFVGGSDAGTFIATISVIASPSPFTGTLTLGGAVAGNFAVTGTGSGPFSLNTYTAALAAGTYSGLTITPTMAGAVGSTQPFGPFTITGNAGGGTGPSATGTLVAEFNTPTGNTVYPALFGTATCTQQDYNWTLVGNSAFRAACKSYPWSLCRYNCNSGASSPMWAAIFGSNPTTTSPNWTNFDLFLTHANEMFDLTKTWIVLGLGGVSGAGLDLMGDNISQFCGMVQLIGNRLKSKTGSDGKLVPIKAFEFLNEPDTTRVDVNTYHSYFDAVADTLHTIDQTWQLWGPVTPNNGSYDSSFLALETTAHLGAFCDHAYLKCPFDANPSDAQMAAATPPAGTEPGGWMTDRRAMIEAHGLGTTLPIVCGEYDIDCYPPTDPRTFTIIGALMCNSFTRKLFQNAGTHPAYAANWELGADGNYGLFQANSGNEYNDTGYHIVPKGAFLSKAGSVVAGAEVSCQSVHGMTSYAVKSGAAFAHVTMNPPGNGSKTETVALSHCPVNTSGNFTAHVWTQNVANPTGTLSTATVTAGVVSVTFADSSNTIIYYP